MELQELKDFANKNSLTLIETIALKQYQVTMLLNENLQAMLEELSEINNKT